MGRITTPDGFVLEVDDSNLFDTYDRLKSFSTNKLLAPPAPVETLVEVAEPTGDAVATLVESDQLIIDETVRQWRRDGYNVTTKFMEYMLAHSNKGRGRVGFNVITNSRGLSFTVTIGSDKIANTGNQIEAKRWADWINRRSNRLYRLNFPKDVHEPTAKQVARMTARLVKHKYLTPLTPAAARAVRQEISKYRFIRSTRSGKTMMYIPDPRDTRKQIYNRTLDIEEDVAARFLDYLTRVLADSGIPVAVLEQGDGGQLPAGLQQVADETIFTILDNYTR